MNDELNFKWNISRQGSDSVKWNRYPEDVLPLWVADMDFPSPPEVVAALQERVSHPFYGYGCEDEELLDAICEWIFARHGWQIDKDWLLLVPGVVAGMNWAIQSVITSDQKLAFQTPVYPPFFKFAGNAGTHAVEIPLTRSTDGYGIDFDRFQDGIKECGVFAFCNPHNPVGRVFSQDELEGIADICLKNQVIICSDEIHCDLVYPEYRHVPIASLSDEVAGATITLMAPSKTFNIPGLEFSFAIVPNERLRERMQLSRRGLLGHPNILSFPAARAAYLHGAEWLDELLVYFQGNRDFIQRFLLEYVPDIGFFPPEGTYLAWLDCSGLDLPKSPYTFFLEEAKVAFNNGKDFGRQSGDFIRLNFGTPRSILKEALDRMKTALDRSK